MTPTRRLSVLLPAALAAVLAAPALTAADDGAAALPRVPPRSESALEAHARLSMAEDATDARRAVISLRMRGGFEASEILLRAARKGTPDVRADAIEALGQIGIRTRETLSLLRDRATDELRPAERVAALEALGHLGGGRDVQTLLDALRAKRGSTRTAAFQSLTRLSGERLPASPTRVAQWWARHDKQHRGYLYKALDSMPLAVKERRTRDIEVNRDIVANKGWLDLGAVELALDEWLRSHDDTLRDAAFHVIAALKLGNYVGTVRSEFLRPSRRMRCPAALEARVALGIAD